MQTLPKSCDNWGFCILNFAQAGFSFEQKYVIARQEVTRYRPALIMWEDWVEWMDYSLIGDTAYGTTTYHVRPDGFIGVAGDNGLQEVGYSKVEDDQPVEVTHFSADRVPISLGIVLDVSGSMATLNRFDIAKRIIRALVSRLKKGDQVALLIFADSMVELLVDFTTDQQRMVERMEKLQPYGGTALRNAVAYCSRLLIENVGKKGIVLLSDGVDTRSEISANRSRRRP